MVLVQNKYKNTLVGVLRTQITFVMHSSPSCYVTLRTQVIKLHSGNLGPQKTDSGVFIIISYSGILLVRPPLLCQKCGLSRGVPKLYIAGTKGMASQEGFHWFFKICQNKSMLNAESHTF